MYEDIFAQIRSEAEKRNLKETTINAYCKSVGYFLRIVNKDVSALTTDDVDASMITRHVPVGVACPFGNAANIKKLGFILFPESTHTPSKHRFCHKLLQ